jgi:hypothetical protein
MPDGDRNKLADHPDRASFKDQFQEMILSQPFEPSEPDRLSDILPRIFVSLYFGVYISNDYAKLEIKLTITNQ